MQNTFRGQIQPHSPQGIATANTAKFANQKVKDLQVEGQREINGMRVAAQSMNQAYKDRNHYLDKKAESELKKAAAWSTRINTLVQDAIIPRLEQERINKKIETYNSGINLALRLEAGDPSVIPYFEKNDEYFKAWEEQKKIISDGYSNVVDEIKKQELNYKLTQGKLRFDEEWKLLQVQKILSNDIAIQGFRSARIQRAVGDYPGWKQSVTTPRLDPEKGQDYWVQVQHGGEIRNINVNAEYETISDIDLRNKVDGALLWDYINANDGVGPDGRSDLPQQAIQKLLINPLVKELNKERQEDLNTLRESVKDLRKNGFTTRFDNSLQKADSDGGKAFFQDLNAVALLPVGENHLWESQEDKKKWIKTAITTSLSKIGQTSRSGYNDIYDVIPILTKDKLDIPGVGKMSFSSYLGYHGNDLHEFLGKLKTEAVTRNQTEEAHAAAEVPMGLRSARDEYLKAVANGDTKARAKYDADVHELTTNSNWFQAQTKKKQQEILARYAPPSTFQDYNTSKIWLEGEKGRWDIEGSKPEITSDFITENNPNFNPKLLRELIDNGVIVNETFAELDDPHSAGSKAFSNAYPELTRKLQEASGRKSSDELVSTEVTRISKLLKPTAVNMGKFAKNLEKNKYEGNDLGAFQLGLKNLEYRIMADNPNIFKSRFSDSQWADIEKNHSSRAYNDGINFNYQQRSGFTGIPHKLPEGIITTAVKNQTFNTDIRDRVYNNDNPIDKKGGILTPFESQDSEGFELYSTSNEGEVSFSQAMQTLAKLDDRNRSLVDIYWLQQDKLGQTRTDFKTLYPITWEEHKLHNQQNRQTRELIKQGGEATSRANDLMANQEDLPISYRINNDKFASTFEGPIPEMHFNSDLIYGAELQSTSYAEFLKNPKDQLKASRWLSQKYLALASEKSKNANVIIRMAATAIKFGEDNMGKWNNIEDISDGKGGFWKEGDDPNMDLYSMGIYNSYRAGNKTTSEIFIPSAVRLGTQISENERVELAKLRTANVLPVVERQQNIKLALEAAQAEAPIEEPLARSLLGDTVVDGLLAANRGDHRGFQEALWKLFNEQEWTN